MSYTSADAGRTDTSRSKLRFQPATKSWSLTTPTQRAIDLRKWCIFLLVSLSEKLKMLSLCLQALSRRGRFSWQATAAAAWCLSNNFYCAKDRTTSVLNLQTLYFWTYFMQLENVVGSRHRLHPCIVHETYRGSSHVRLADGSVESQKPWKTTNQACYAQEYPPNYCQDTCLYYTFHTLLKEMQIGNPCLLLHLCGLTLPGQLLKASDSTWSRPCRWSAGVCRVQPS